MSSQRLDAVAMRVALVRVSQRNVVLVAMVAVGFAAWSVHAPSIAADPIPVVTIEHPEPVDFQREVLPILQKKCLACHNATDAESSLVLETPQGILTGGNEGPAIVAGQPDESLLYGVASMQSEPVMPPEDNEVGAEPLTSEELALLRLWIEQGGKGEVKAVAKAIEWQDVATSLQPVLAVALSRDGRYLAAGRASQIPVFRTADQKLIAHLVDHQLAEPIPSSPGARAHLDFVQSLAVSPDGQWIASGGFRTVKLWRRTVRSESGAMLPIADLHNLCTSRDGSSLWGSTNDGEVLRMDVRSGELTAKSVALSSKPILISVAADDKAVAAICEDGVVRIYNLPREASDQAGWFDLAAKGPANRLLWAGADHLLVARADHAIEHWTASSDSERRWELKHELQGHAQSVIALAALGGDQVASADESGAIHIWNLAEGKSTRNLNAGGAVRSLAGSTSSQRLVAVGSAGFPKLWSLEDGNLIAELSADLNLQAQFDKAQHNVQVAQRQIDNTKRDHDEGIKRRDQEVENQKKVNESLETARQDLASKQEASTQADTKRSEAETQLATIKQQLADAEQSLQQATDEPSQAELAKKVEEAKTQVGPAEQTLKESTEAANKAAGELKTSQEAAQTAERSVERANQAVKNAEEALGPLQSEMERAAAVKTEMDAVLQNVEQTRQQQTADVATVDVADEGKQVVTISAGGSYRLWSASNGAALEQSAASDANPIRAWITGDGQLALLDQQGQVTLSQLEPDWQLERTIGAVDDATTFNDRVTALDFSPDSQTLAVGGGEPSRAGELKIFRVDDGQLVREFVNAHSDAVFAVAFSPDGTRLASGAADRFLKVHDVSTGELQRNFEGHTHHVLDVAWQADGRVIVSAGADKVVKVWDTVTGGQIRTIQGFGKEVTSLDFVGSTEMFFAASGDQTLYRCDTAGNRNGIGRGGDFLYSVSTNLTGNVAAFAGHDSIIRLVDRDGKVQAEWKPQ